MSKLKYTTERGGLFKEVDAIWLSYVKNLK